MTIEFPIIEKLIIDLREYGPLMDAQEEFIWEAARRIADAVRQDEREWYLNRGQK